MATEDGGLRNLGADEQFNERVRVFQEFLDEDYGHNEYKERIRKMVATGERRLIVNINDLREYRREYAEGLLQIPMEYLPAFDKAFKDICLTIHNQPGQKLDDKNFAVGLEGSFGEHQVSPRSISAKHLGKMICVEGIITKCSIVRPKVVRSVHYCEKTQVFHAREYRDGTSLSNAVPTGSVYPKEDDEGNPLTTEFGFSTYRDYQTASLQEMPERAPAGQLPRPIDVILDDDLVDRVKPGDRVMIVGVYRSLGKHAASVSALFRTVILANHVKLLGKQIQQPLISDVDIQEIRKMGKREHIFELLSMSLAPSIYGHDFIKKATLLLLLGGMEKNLENGTHLRGDINMLLIGDPSTAKSQMLRFVLNTAPLAIATTGRGSSGVGLTAAVTQDRDTGERTLEAGAMVLADRGVVCIDEFDKMNDIDRVAIHEVMEQQTVTIAKAGIHTSLNARCSVLAAANPVYGNYRTDLRPFENIALPDSLLSRFDLVFVVLDTTDEEANRTLADHVVRVHRFIPPGTEEGAPIAEQSVYGMRTAEDDEPERTEVFQKYNPLLHVGIRPLPAEGRGGRRKKGPAKPELLSINFVKKYIHYAKTRIKPVLTQEASEYIAKEYVELRGQKEGEANMHRTMPITARTLETLIRLSTAHAKARLSQRVDEIDGEVAVEILKFALYKEVDQKKKRKKARVNRGGDSDDSDNGGDSDGGSDGGSDEEYRGLRTTSRVSTPRKGSSRVGTPRKTTKRPIGTSGGGSQPNVDEDGFEIGDEEDVPLTRTTRTAGSGRSTGGTLSSSQFESDDMVVDSEESQSQSASGSGSQSALTPARLDQFRQNLHAVRQLLMDNGSIREGDTVMVHDIIEQVNSRLPGSQQFDVEEVRGALQAMSDQNTTLWYQPDKEAVIFL
ncbi:MCM DNA helicase complex subunit [Borealophlyctis nickersoniae]|nr:MCM DNA helicase complex subunit [Borealophlyctis nickersoniae]